jgi:hypothetical protein
VRDDPRADASEHVASRERRSQAHGNEPGPLDLLGTIEETTGFPELIADSDSIHLVSRARVLKLERLIQIKQRLGRPKDQAMLPLLLATLDEINRSK